MKRNTQIHTHGGMEVVSLPVLRDNYIFLLHERSSRKTAVIDPALVDPVMVELERRGWELNYILNTHHHNDHVGGNLQLKQRTGCKVAGYGPDAVRIPGIDIELTDKEKFSFGDAAANVLFVPGHTLGHVAYHFAGEAILFCGDALFLMGCGRLFEGTAQQALSSLERLATLPDDTHIYCTHEYTQANGKFALVMEPDNETLKERMRRIKEVRKTGGLTIPGSIGEEKLTNPFLRCDSKEIRKNIGMESASKVEVFAEIRKRKDAF